MCSIDFRSLQSGFAVPMSNRLYIWRESALMIVAPYSRASVAAIEDLPAAVGPQMTRTLFPSKSPLQLVPRELDDSRAAVHVVRGEFRITERCEKCPHLALRERFARLDGGLARNGRREMLVTRSGTRDPVARQRIERLPQAALGIESTMRHRDCVHDERASAEAFNLESDSLEIFAVRLERIGFGRTKVERDRK
jgi:hypothetical protein